MFIIFFLSDCNKVRKLELSHPQINLSFSFFDLHGYFETFFMQKVRKIELSPSNDQTKHDQERYLSCLLDFHEGN